MYTIYIIQTIHTIHTIQTIHTIHTIHTINTIEKVPSLLKEGGCLVLISPYSWLEEYTPIEEWIGGKRV